MFPILCSSLVIWSNLFHVASALDRVDDVLHVKAWQSKAKYPTATDYPENYLDEIQTKPNVGIAFSGGGSRSYTATLGYLAGLHELGLLDKVRYIGGMSGGSWASTVYTYAQNGVDDGTFLGRVVPPEQIEYEGLKAMDSDCARSYTKEAYTITTLKAWKDKTAPTLADAWCYALQKQYLDPVGITENTRFSWSEATVADIKQRNPSLSNETFLIPANPQRPFLVIGSSMVGPTEGAPYTADAHNFTMLEFTPLYSGQMYSLDVQYEEGNKLVHRKHVHTTQRRIGGAVESWAVAPGDQVDGISPVLGLSQGQTEGVLQVPVAARYMDLAHAAGASGYAPGAFFESSHIPTVADKAGMHVSYWSPTEHLKPTATDMLIADGGCYTDTPIMSYLQRKVTSIVLFMNHKDPLQPCSPDYCAWNVSDPSVPPSDEQIDDSIQSYFGVFDPPSNRVYERSFMVRKNHVFPTERYADVITALQAGQAAGTGAIATVKLTTVANEWWGIEAGFETEVTFVYLSRLGAWEAALSPEMQAMVVPTDGNPADYSNTIDKGEFRHFPHYTTSGGLLSAQQTNLLADMTGWSVLQNKALFQRILGGTDAV